MYAKSLREQQGRLAVEMQTIIDTAKNENNRGLTADERTKFDKLVDEHNKLEDSIKAAEKATTITAKLAEAHNPGGIVESNLEQVQDEMRLSPGEKRMRDKDPRSRAFAKYLRAGMSALDLDERKAMNFMPHFQNTMSTTTGSQGGYVVPQGFSDMLEEAKKWFGGIEGVVDTFKTSTGNPWPWPTINDTANKGRIIGQNTQVTETDLAFGQVTFNAYIGSSDLVLVPLALMEDSYFDLDALVARLLGTRLGRLYNNKCTVGTGTNEPTGIVTAAVAAGAINTFPTGETTAIAYTDLVNVEHTVDPDYRYNPSTRWMFADAVLKLIKKLVDGQSRPLWQPGLTASFRDGAAVDLIAAKPTILDHPYVINQDMASPSASANTVLFGDMSAFKVRQVAGGTTVMRLTERYADYLQVGFTAFERFDSQLVDSGTHPVAVGQQSAT
jgi:HK97 family phage major capsid protein